MTLKARFMNNKSKVSYSFGNYLLEVSERRLWKDSELVSLTPKAFETLVVLVANRGHIVEKNVLLEKVWTDSFVEEGVLSQNIFSLRKILGTFDDGKPFIETVPRTGYRFLAQVKEIISDDEIVILERRVKSEITAEQKIVSSSEAVAVTHTYSNKTSLVKNFFGYLRANKIRTAMSSFASVSIIAALTFSGYYSLQPRKFSLAKFNQTNVSKLTSEGNLSSAVISPDGKYLAYVETLGNSQRIVVKQLKTSSIVEVLSPQEKRISGLSFSPDGNHLFFNLLMKESLTSFLVGQLYKIPLLGGTPQEIISDVDSPAAISPDGGKLAFVRNSPTDKKSLLIVASSEGKEEKILAERVLSQGFSLKGLAWSPDGKTIACAVYEISESKKQMDLILVDTATGNQKSLTNENWILIGQIAWLTDGSGVVFPAWNASSSHSIDEIWLASMDGVTKQISSGINGVMSLSLTTDSNSIAVIKSDRLTDFWIASEPNLEKGAKTLQNLAEFNLLPPGIGFMNNGKIVFGSTFNGNLDIWKMNADGTQRQLLTNDKAADYFPIASNDGEKIFFISNRSGHNNLWRMNADSNKQEQLTDEVSVKSPSISPDNQTIYYTVPKGKNEQFVLQKLNLETRTTTQITSLLTLYPILSPDGKYIACYFPEAVANGFNEKLFKLTILSAEDGRVIKQFGAPYYKNSFAPIQWKSSENLTYITFENDTTKLWGQSVKGDKANLLLEMPQTELFRFAWSSNGKSLIYEKGTTLNNAFLISSSD